jgi:hypothetical protein
MMGVPNSPTMQTTPSLQRPGRFTNESVMAEESVMGATPSTMAGGPVGIPIQQRVIDVTVENTGPGMFRYVMLRKSITLSYYHPGTQMLEVE